MVLEHFHELIDQIAHKPFAAIGIVVNLIIIESLLSVDNAAVLATMVLDLPKDQRKKALRYGILGAYIFRGICLLFAAILIKIWWFKPVGGIYLLVLAFRFFFGKKGREEASPANEIVEVKRNWIYRKTFGALGPFWATVVLVEIMDMAFSIDNVIAANAYSKNIILVWTGVFIGILAMRFVSQGFIKLMEKYSFLESCAFSVIALLGIKLVLSGYAHFYPCGKFAAFMEGPAECPETGLVAGEHPLIMGDILTSAFSLGIFFIPILTSTLFKWPKHKPKSEMSQD